MIDIFKNKLLGIKLPLITLATALLVLTSCTKKDDDYPSAIPTPNKSVFDLSESPDTLYDTHNQDFRLAGIEIMDLINNSELSTANFLAKDKDVYQDSLLIGKVEYEGGEVSKVNLCGWCTITRISMSKHKKAFLIEKTNVGQINNKYICLGLLVNKGLGTTIIIQ